jgi:hypothetical protein
LKKETEDTRKTFHVCGLEGYCENGWTTESNPYKIQMSFFTEIENSNLKFYASIEA